jgi:hypothetical protein
MAWVPIDNVGKLGVIKDVADHSLPPEAWTTANNIRFDDNGAAKIEGHAVPTSLGTPSVTPHFCMPLATSSDVHWIYGSLSKLYGVNDDVHKDLTRASGGDYNTNVDSGWVGAVKSGIAILTNGVDEPQFWAGDFATPTKFASLTNWPASVTCRSIKAFKNFLVAVNVTKSGTHYPHMVKWSHPAVPGALPSSWDETDATKDAGEVDIAETDGFCVDSLPLGDINVIYKEDSCYAMQFIGGQNIFRFPAISRSAGIISENCATNTPGGHIVLTADDLILNNGRDIISIVDGVLRKELFDDIDLSLSQRCFVVTNPAKSEVWVCYPETDQSCCTKALIYNYKEKTFTFRELPQLAHAAIGKFVSTLTDETWDADSGVWDDDSEIWDARGLGDTFKLIGASPNGVGLLTQFDLTNQDNGANTTTTLERTGLALLGTDRQGQPKVDYDNIKFCRGVRPLLEGSASLSIHVATSMTRNETPVWHGPFTYDPSTDLEVNCQVAGRFFGVRFSSTGNQSWNLKGYELDLELMGGY